MMTPVSGSNNPIALVSGAASGIGRATADLLAQRGQIVHLADIQHQACRDVAADLAGQGRSAFAHHLDVTQPDHWQRVVQQIIDQHGRIDILINAAGISHAAAVQDLQLEDWRRVMAVNLDGVMLGARQVGPRLVAQPSGGCIVNVASIAGVKAFPGAAAYAASKAAVIHFSKCLAKELRPQNPLVRVNVISPAGVRTPMWQSMPFFQDMIREHGGEAEAFAALASTAPAKRLADPDEVAHAIAYLVSDQARYLSGINLPFDDGEHA